MKFNSYAATETSISDAYDAIYYGWYKNCIQAASVYEVLIRRLQRQWIGSSTRAPTNKIITEEQEGAIHEYNDRLDKINICAHPQMIVGATNYLICLRMTWLATNGCSDPLSEIGSITSIKK